MVDVCEWCCLVLEEQYPDCRQCIVSDYVHCYGRNGAESCSHYVRVTFPYTNELTFVSAPTCSSNII
jgi:hypothetical protein